MSKKKGAKNNRATKFVHEEPQSKSRLILYHGTTTLRLAEIMAENRLRKRPSGHPVVSLTVQRSVAEYFACNAVFTDRMFRPAKSSGVLLTLDGEKLLRDEYEPFSYSDPYYGASACDWEDEVCCPIDIPSLKEYLIDIVPVGPDLQHEYESGGRSSFKPTTPPMSRLLLLVARETVNRLEDESISEQEAADTLDQLHQLTQWIFTQALSAEENAA